MIDQPTIDALTASVCAWVSAAAHELGYAGEMQKLELLHRALIDPDLEAAIRIQFKAGRIVIEVSNDTHKVELFVVEVEPVRPAAVEVH